MIRTIYLDAKLDKQLQALNRAGKKAVLAAKQAQDIISKLRAGGPMVVDNGAITKHGELRIKGCVKYDLGSGYRLVTFKQGMDLLVLYIGSHDDSHRWIENNRKLPVDMIRQRSRAIPVESTHDEKKYNAIKKEMMDGQESDDFDDELEDHQLRSIFSGLIESAQTPR